ncbi:MAG: hypothetical protein QXE51_04045 [Nitrososphaeria archaeon]
MSLPPIPVDITVSVSPSGKGLVKMYRNGQLYGMTDSSMTRTVFIGDSIKLEAVEITDYKFDKWSNGSTNRTISFTAIGNDSYTAYFKKVESPPPPSSDKPYLKSWNVSISPKKDSYRRGFDEIKLIVDFEIVNPNPNKWKRAGGFYEGASRLSIDVGDSIIISGNYKKKDGELVYDVVDGKNSCYVTYKPYNHLGKSYTVRINLYVYYTDGSSIISISKENVTITYSLEDPVTLFDWYISKNPVSPNDRLVIRLENPRIKFKSDNSVYSAKFSSGSQITILGFQAPDSKNVSDSKIEYVYNNIQYYGSQPMSWNVEAYVSIYRPLEVQGWEVKGPVETETVKKLNYLPPTQEPQPPPSEPPQPPEPPEYRAEIILSKQNVNIGEEVSAVLKHNLPLVPTGLPAMISWGDGSVEQFTQYLGEVTKKHIYVLPGTFRIDYGVDGIVANPQFIVVNEPISIPPTQYTISVYTNPQGWGKVEVYKNGNYVDTVETGIKQYSFSSGDKCKLKAIANSGYEFKMFTKNGNQITTNPYEFSVNSSSVVQAVFQVVSGQPPIPPSGGKSVYIFVNPQGWGFVDVYINNNYYKRVSGEYVSVNTGDKVRCVAIASGGKYFSKWIISTGEEKTGDIFEFIVDNIGWIQAVFSDLPTTPTTPTPDLGQELMKILSMEIYGIPLWLIILILIILMVIFR